MPETTKPPTRTPIAWITWLRLLAVLAVVAIHNAGANAGAAAKGDLRKSNLLGVILDIPFVIAVPLFVMVSGTLALSPAGFKGARNFLNKRILRLVPAIVFWNLFYLFLLQFWFIPGRDWTDMLRLVLNSKHVPHLYFLWIVLGLSLLTPLLIRWLANSSRKEQLWTAAGFAAIPVITMGSRDLRGSQVVLLEVPWTWWFAYLGLYLFGYLLRDVVLTGWKLAANTLLWVGLLVLLSWQYVSKGAAPLLDAIAPVSYHGLTVVVASIACFLTFRSTIREGGLLGFLARPSVLKWVNPISLASLGIFAVHIAVMWLFIKYGIFGPGLTTGPNLLLRLLAVAAISVAIAVVARRIPFVRRVF